MPSSYTTNLNLELQATGENSGTWGSLLNANDFTVVDSVLGNVQTISLSGSDVTLTTSQTQVNFIKLTGALTANVNVIFPAIGRTYFVQNSTTGAFAVTLKITGSGGATAVVPQNPGQGQAFILDGINVYADFGGRAPGEIAQFAMQTPPFGWLAFSATPVSRTAYPALFAAIGTTYGAGDGSTTFNIPPPGYFSRAWNGTASGPDAGRSFGSTEADAYASHTHGVNDPGHTHEITLGSGGGNAFALNQPARWSNDTALGSSPTATTAGSYTGISNQYSGGTETRPINIAFLYAIKW